MAWPQVIAPSRVKSAVSPQSHHRGCLPGGRRIKWARPNRSGKPTGLLCDGGRDGSQRPKAANQYPAEVPILPAVVLRFVGLTWASP